MKPVDQSSAASAREPRSLPVLWRWVIAITLVVAGALGYLHLSQADVVANVTGVSKRDGNVVAQVRVLNRTDSEVHLLGMDADRLAFDVVAPGEPRLGPVGWCGTETLKFWRLEAGESMTTEIPLPERLGSERLQVVFFPEATNSKFQQRLLLQANKLPNGARASYRLQNWFDYQQQVYTRPFVPDRITP